MHVSICTISLILGLSGVVHAHSDPLSHRRHHARLVPEVGKVERELAGQGFNSTSALEPSSTGPTSSSDQSSTTSSETSASTDSSLTSSATSSSSSSSATSTTPTSTSTSSTTTSSSSSSTTSSSTSSTSSTTTSSSTSTSSQTPINQGPATIIPATSASTTTVMVPSQVVPDQYTTLSSTVTDASTPTSNQLDSSSHSSGISKPALIAIIVVAVVVGLIAIAWTLFRKYKLKKSGNFDNRMKSIDFGLGPSLHDEFFEKTLQRGNSFSSTVNQRNLLAAEVDADSAPNHVAGIPEHDFTAGATNEYGAGAYDMEMYNQDPYYHAEAYEYDAAYDSHQAYPPGGVVGSYANPHQQTYATDQVTQDQPINHGYADLQRGNSGGSGSGHGHTHGHAISSTATAQVFPSEFPDPQQYLGRPTGHGEGPYAQAATYRAY